MSSLEEKKHLWVFHAIREIITSSISTISCIMDLLLDEQLDSNCENITKVTLNIKLWIQLFITLIVITFSFSTDQGSANQGV